MAFVHLVTGGSGYFGSVLVAKLRTMGCQLRVFDLNDADDRPPDVEFIQGDIRDYKAVARACRDVAVVYHNVATVPLAKDAQAFWSVNCDGTTNLLRTCLELRVGKVVHTSSSAVFGIPTRNPIDDTVEPMPQEEYGRAKLAAEKQCLAFVDKGLDVAIIRPRTILGAGRMGIMQILFEWIYEGRNIPVLGKGDNLYQFVHADDVAEACVKAAERKGPAVYNVGAEKFCSMRETLEGLIAHAKTGSRVVSVPMWPAVAMMKLTSQLGLSPLAPYHWLMYGRSMYFDVSRPKRELGWTPKYGNIEMFCETYDWYVANRAQILRQLGSRHRSPVKQGILKIVGRFL
jgi:nucleoside-diphosphate-sugar epimerase